MWNDNFIGFSRGSWYLYVVCALPFEKCWGWLDIGCTTCMIHSAMSKLHCFLRFCLNKHQFFLVKFKYHQNCCELLSKSMEGFIYIYIYVFCRSTNHSFFGAVSCFFMVNSLKKTHLVWILIVISQIFSASITASNKTCFLGHGCCWIHHCLHLFHVHVPGQFRRVGHISPLCSLAKITFFISN